MTICNSQASFLDGGLSSAQYHRSCEKFLVPLSKKLTCTSDSKRSPSTLPTSTRSPYPQSADTIHIKARQLSYLSKDPPHLVDGARNSIRKISSIHLEVSSGGIEHGRYAETVTESRNPCSDRLFRHRCRLGILETPHRGSTAYRRPPVLIRQRSGRCPRLTYAPLHWRTWMPAPRCASFSRLNMYLFAPNPPTNKIA